jgi:hypothetical protein
VQHLFMAAISAPPASAQAASNSSSISAGKHSHAHHTLARALSLSAPLDTHKLLVWPGEAVMGSKNSDVADLTAAREDARKDAASEAASQDAGSGAPPEAASEAASAAMHKSIQWPGLWSRV